MKYKSNRNIVFSCNYHVVFCPKYRRPVLVDGVDERFKEIAWEVAGELGFEIAEMEVMPDHVHLLLSIDPQLSIHRAIKRIKPRPARGVPVAQEPYTDALDEQLLRVDRGRCTARAGEEIHRETEGGLVDGARIQISNLPE